MASANSSRTPSRWWEWNAWLTFSRLVFTPAARKDSAVASTGSASPEITTERGPLTAAMLTPDTGSSARTSPSSALTATIAPPDRAACISRPRASTSVQASDSDSTPATCAAVTSPIE
ncbi:hypothetical protein Save01_08298 [Streptomyces avermitilis]